MKDEMPPLLKAAIFQLAEDKDLWEKVRAMELCKVDIVIACNGGKVVRVMVQEKA